MQKSRESRFDFLTVSEVAKALRVRKSTIYRWISEGDLSALKAGSKILIRPNDIERFLKGGE